MRGYLLPNAGRRRFLSGAAAPRSSLHTNRQPGCTTRPPTRMASSPSATGRPHPGQRPTARADRDIAPERALRVTSSRCASSQDRRLGRSSSMRSSSSPSLRRGVASYPIRGHTPCGRITNVCKGREALVPRPASCYKSAQCLARARRPISTAPPSAAVGVPTGIGDLPRRPAAARAAHAPPEERPPDAVPGPPVDTGRTASEVLKGSRHI